MSNLDERITLFRDELQHQPRQAFLLDHLASLLLDQFYIRGDIDGLDEALTLNRATLLFQPEGHPHRTVSLSKIARCLYARFMRFGKLPDLEEALALERNAFQLLPREHPHRANSLSSIATYLHARFRQLGTLSDLDEALALEQYALRLHPQGHPHRAASLGNMASCFCARFIHLGTMSDLESALSLQRNALQLYQTGHPGQASSLSNLANCLHDRFRQLGMLSDLEEAIMLQHNALDLYPHGHPDRAVPLSNLAGCLHTRFLQLGALSDLDEALALQRSASQFLPQGHPDRASSLSNLANYLHYRFRRLGMLSDLEEAITLQCNALELYPQGHPDRAVLLSNHASCLRTRFLQLGALSDLNEAVSLQSSALQLLPPGHPDRASSLSNLAHSLLSRFEQLGTLFDLDEALSLQYCALQLRPQRHPDRAISLSNIASGLYSRFKQLGTLSDLDEALGLERDALQLYSQCHPHRATSLSNLANYLHSRFEQLGAPPDLAEALALYHNALECYPQGHPDRATSLGSLACCLYARFEHFGTLTDLDEALALERNALQLLPQWHPDRPISLGNIATYLFARFEQRGVPSDLDEALSLQCSALQLRPQGHPHRAVSLSNLANYLHSRFKLHGRLSDLDDALALQYSALELRPHGHPHQASSLSNIATYLHTRLKHSSTNDTSDLQEIFYLYSQLSDLSQTVSSADLECAKQWIRAAEEYKHSTTVSAYETFFRLCVHHLATIPSLPQHLVLLKQLVTSTAVDAFSACLRYGNLPSAVELLEQGRGVFWSQLIRLRSPLDDVIASGETGNRLAEKFTQLASMLRTVLDALPNAESQHNQASHLSIQLQDITTEIRKLPGLSRFLLPSLFSDLQIAAAGGPVIIVNVSQYSCDALIVLLDQDPVHVALPITKTGVSELSSNLRSLTLRAKFEDVTRELLMFLRRLWDVVVYPIVEILQEFCPSQSRIWWCPTAEFSLLPLHAAGPFRKGQPTLSDLYISSYTPTLTALIRARQNRQLDPSIERHHFLVVGQAQAPGQDELVSVNTELSSILRRLGSVATLTCIQDQDANITNVTDELSKNEFVHLACHGIPDRKRPFESGFALSDGLLKVENIMRYNLQNAQFAYLSACHTTVGDEESPDEVIHLAAAMQFAGFRSVIGTMWAVDDAHTEEITSKFYEYMLDESGRFDHTRAALALHKTMQSSRPSDIPFDQQILYIHIGA